MKNKMVSILILALLNLWIPYANAENSQDLDPMVSPDAQATVTEDTSTGAMTAGQASNVVSTTDTVTPEKKVEEPKKEKSKKSSKKKSSEKNSEKKKKKTPPASTKKHKKSSR
ncbi:MAG: hypothetical protein WC133_01490 [Candidatus Omnitrophota bacterium]